MINNISDLSMPWLTPIGPISETMKIRMAPKTEVERTLEAQKRESRPSQRGLGIHVDLIG